MEMRLFFLRFYMKFVLIVLLIPASIHSGPTTSESMDKSQVLIKNERATLNEMIVDASKFHGVDLALVMAVVKAESNFNVEAISSRGATGLMQLMPITAKHLGIDDVRNTFCNIDGGVRYLAELLNKYKGSIKLTLAAYNAGPGTVWKYRGVPPYKETRKYIKNVLKFKKEYNTLLKLKGEYLT
jgi:soluble lytic murein transglycosylase-like protein